jgi:hypothetical protein
VQIDTGAVARGIDFIMAGGGACTLPKTVLLSVWRRLYLELDSMPPGADLHYCHEVNTIVNNTPHAGDGCCEMDWFEPEDNGRFEHGELSFDYTQPWTCYAVIDNMEEEWSDDKIITSTPIAAAEDGKSGLLLDDDRWNLMPVLAPTTVLSREMARAYIEVVVVTEPGVQDLDVPLVSTVEQKPERVWNVVSPKADLVPLVDYWVARIDMCHQGKNEGEGTASSCDGDPNYRYHIHGTTFKSGDQLLLYGTTHPTRNASLVFHEAAKEEEYYITQQWEPAGPTLTDMLATTAAHETVHQFGYLPHDAGTLMQSGALSSSLTLNLTHIEWLRTHTVEIGSDDQ